MNRFLPWLVLAIAVPIAIAVALVPFREQMSSANLALFMVVGAVAVAAAGTRFSLSMLCAAMTALCYDVFLVRPYYSVTIAEPSEAVTSGLVLVVVAVVGSVSRFAREQRSLTIRREENLGLLYQLVDQVATAAGETALVSSSEREIGELLAATACRYETEPSGPPGETDPRVADAELDQVGEVRIGDELWDTDQRGLPDRRLRVPVQSAGLHFGAFVVEPDPGRRVARWELITTVMIADLVGAALARWPAES